MRAACPIAVATTCAALLACAQTSAIRPPVAEEQASPAGADRSARCARRCSRSCASRSALPLNEYEDEARRLPAQLLPPRRAERLEGRQARPRHRPVDRHLCERQMDGQLLRHACAGADLVLAGDGRVAQGQPAGRRSSPAGRDAAGAGRRHDVKEMYPPPGRRLRERRSAPSAAPTRGRRRHGARQQALARRLVLGLVRLGRTRAGSRTGRQRAHEPATRHGLRPVLHQLPRLGEGQLDLRRAEEHQGRAGRAAGLPQPELLPRSVVAEPAEPHRSRPAPRPRRGRPARTRLQSGLHQDASPGSGGPPDRDAIVEDAVGDLRQRLGEGRRADRGRASSSPRINASAATAPAAPACNTT